MTHAVIVAPGPSLPRACRSLLARMGIACVMLAGCAQHGDRGEPVSMMAGGALADATGPALPAGALYRPGLDRSYWQVATLPAQGGLAKPAGIERRDATGPDGDGTWRVERWIRDPGSASAQDAAHRDYRPRFSLAFRRGGNGAILLAELINHDEGTIARFSPPMELMPAELPAGRVHRAQAGVELLDARTSARSGGRDDRASVETTWQPAADEPGQKGQARVAITIETRGARVTRTTTFVLARDGDWHVTREERELRVRAMGVTLRREREEATMTLPPADERDPVPAGLR